MSAPICIDSRVLGTSQHLVVDKMTRTFVDKIPVDAWLLTGAQKENSNRCLDTLLALERFNIDLLPPEVYVRSWEKFLPQGKCPPWKACMPESVHHAFLEGIVSKVVGAFERCDQTFYKNTWGHQTAVFQSLHRATVREEVYDALIKDNPDNVPLKSFSPNNKELAKKVVYDRISARLGRPTIEAGPQALTLRKDLRRVICPSSSDRVIKTYDFRALEMRVLLYEAEHQTIVGDLYEILGHQYLSGVPRNVVKGAVISQQYGQSHHVWGPKMGLQPDEARYIDDVLVGLFRNDVLMDVLRTQYRDHGFIRNKYGRKVIPANDQDHILRNAYAQSTGSDVALLGFSTLLKGFERLDVKPLFLIVDCMVIDTPISAVKTLEKLNILSVKEYKQKYELLLEDIVKGDK